MRQLTQKEIENAPDWANSVFENGHGSLCWFNNETGDARRVGDQYGNAVQMSDVHYSFKTCKPINAIPSEEFDAKQQEIECLKNQVSQLKAENSTMAAYADQRIRMLIRANKKLGGEL